MTGGDVRRRKVPAVFAGDQPAAGSPRASSADADPPPPPAPGLHARRRLPAAGRRRRAASLRAHGGRSSTSSTCVVGGAADAGAIPAPPPRPQTASRRPRVHRRARARHGGRGAGGSAVRPSSLPPIAYLSAGTLRQDLPLRRLERTAARRDADGDRRARRGRGARRPTAAEEATARRDDGRLLLGGPTARTRAPTWRVLDASRRGLAGRRRVAGLWRGGGALRSLADGRAANARRARRRRRVRRLRCAAQAAVRFVGLARDSAAALRVTLGGAARRRSCSGARRRAARACRTSAQGRARRRRRRHDGRRRQQARGGLAAEGGRRAPDRGGGLRRARSAADGGRALTRRDGHGSFRIARDLDAVLLVAHRLLRPGLDAAHRVAASSETLPRCARLASPLVPRSGSITSGSNERGATARARARASVRRRALLGQYQTVPTRQVHLHTRPMSERTTARSSYGGPHRHFH